MMRPLIGLLLLGLLAGTARADTLRVMTYNILNFRGDEDMNRVDDVRRVIEWVRPDVVCHQEIIAEEAVDVLLSFAYLQVDDDWAAAEFHDGPDTDNALMYRTSKVRFLSQRIIETSLRDIAEYTVQPLALDSSARLRLYSAHLKASSGADNEQQRREEAATLRQQLDLLPAGSMFMVMGDFNLYTADEPAYQVFLDDSPNPLGQLFDPVDRPGDWHESATFADIHTQSPRVESFGGGSTGGVDLNANLVGADLSGQDISGANLSTRNLTGANLTNAIANNVNFSAANLENVNFTGASIQYASFLGAILNGANLSGANLTGASFTGATYNASTIFPAGFNPVVAGLTLVP